MRQEGSNWALNMSGAGLSNPQCILGVTSDGNVGIGAAIPGAKLEVNGSIKLSGSADASSNNEILFADNGQIRSFDDNHRIIFHRSGGTYSNLMELQEYHDIALMPGGSNGVGVGTRTPSSKLDVAGDVEIGNINYFYLGDPGTNGSWRFHVDTSNNLRFERRVSGGWIDKGGFNS